MISLIYWFTCASCGAHAKGMLIRTVRINKDFLRSTDRAGLGWLPRKCEQCGEAIEPVADRCEVRDDDLARINAYRARKGWPELTSSEVFVRAAEGVTRSGR